MFLSRGAPIRLFFKQSTTNYLYCILSKCSFKNLTAAYCSHSLSAHHKTSKCKLSFVSKMHLTLYIQLNFLCTVNIIFTFSEIDFHAIFVMSIERYLGAYHPVLHRTSVTRRRLLIRLAILLSFQTTLNVICINDMIISMPLVLLVFLVAVFLHWSTSTSNCSKFPVKCVEERRHYQKKKRL